MIFYRNAILSLFCFSINKADLSSPFFRLGLVNNLGASYFRDATYAKPRFYYISSEKGFV
jgi:hypothetical protein